MKRLVCSLAVLLSLIYSFSILKISKKGLSKRGFSKFIPNKRCNLLSLNSNETLALIRSISTRFSFLDNCLVRALATTIIYRLSGHTVEIVFGVRNGSRLEAHAWVRDSNAKILMGDTPDRDTYRELINNKGVFG